jgi:hypothetical protein
MSSKANVLLCGTELLDYSSPAKPTRSEKKWGDIKSCWVEPDLRDQMVDFVHHWHERDFAKGALAKGLGIGISKFYSWCDRYGKDNDHNGKMRLRRSASRSSRGYERRGKVSSPKSACAKN